MADQPTSLRGYVDDNSFGLDGFATAVDYLLEHIPELVHPQSVYTYAKMRHDPMVTAILQAYSGPIERAHWSLDPAGCRDEVVAAIADDLGLPVKGDDDPQQTGARRRRFTFADHLGIAGQLYRVYGHMFFEQAWAPQDGRWRLDVVQERMPQTVSGIGLNKDGTLDYVAQGAYANLGGQVKLTTADHRLVYYTRKREGSNYFGEALIRPCYGPWLIKQQVMRVHATTLRRFGMGIPEVEAPDNSPASIAQAQRYASSIAAGEKAGAGLPPGFKSSWRGLSGTLPDALAFINFLNQEMARATITMLLVMVAAERGNRSLGETVMDLMIMAQQADANFLAKEATTQLVIPLVDANWGEDEPAPQISVGNVGADVETTAQDINWLMQWGGLKADQPVRAWIRQLRGMPPEDPNDPVFQTPEPANEPMPPTPSTEAQ